VKKYTLFISMIALFMLAACGNSSNNSEGSNGDQVPSAVEVEVLLPEKIEPNEEVKIEALVTQGEDIVEDANEVTFEVWKQGQEADHEMIEANNEGDGLYSFTKTFEEEGFYYVVAHTTARDMHVMPRAEVTVGNPEKSEHEEGHSHDHDHDSHGEDDHKDHHGHAHEHASALIMTLEHEDTVKAGRETTLSTEIKQEKKALLGADVRFEVWHEDSDKHEFIVAEEIGNGVYEAKTTLKEKGLHYVQIHVEKDELHEHQLEELDAE
jgi:hypothetical protein